MQLGLDLKEHAKGLQPGASVAVNGVCLTATRVNANVVAEDMTESVAEGVAGGIVEFDVIGETLDITTLGSLAVGDKVNIERSMAATDEIGGHLVSGHITGTVCMIDSLVEGQNQRCWFECPHQWLKYIFHKGFVALDGASLTVSEVTQTKFSIDLIPETRARTTLGIRRPGDRINLEIETQTRTTVETIERLLTDPVWLQRMNGKGLLSFSSPA